MSVHCAFCGEEMLGAVNRCWRCGRTFAFAPTQESEPPVRRAAIDGPLDICPGDEPVVAAVVDDGEPVVPLAESTEEASESGASTPPRGESPAATASPSPAAGALRFVVSSPAGHLGSPFSQEFKVNWKDRGRVWCRVPLDWGRVAKRMWRDRRPLTAARRAQSVATVSPARAAFANAALVLSALLGGVSLLLMRYPMIAVLVAIFGLLMAGISLVSQVRFRVLAVAALCFLPLGIVAYREATAWQKAQTLQQQINNWEDE